LSNDCTKSQGTGALTANFHTDFVMGSTTWRLAYVSKCNPSHKTHWYVWAPICPTDNYKLQRLRSSIDLKFQF